MDIVVCVKQTPVPAETEFDEETKTLIREGVALTISSLDRRALLEALRLRDEVGGTVTVLTLGPPQARSALIDTLALDANLRRSRKPNKGWRSKYLAAHEWGHKVLTCCYRGLGSLRCRERLV